MDQSSPGQMDLWAYTNEVQIDFNRRGKPTDNAIVESRKLAVVVVRFYPVSQAGHFLSRQWTEECRQVNDAKER